MKDLEHRKRNRSALWRYKKGKQNRKTKWQRKKKEGTSALVWHKNLWTIANDIALLQSAYRSAAVSGQVCRPFAFIKQTLFINGFHNSWVDAHLFQRHWSRNQLHRHLSAPLVPDRLIEGTGEYRRCWRRDSPLWVKHGLHRECYRAIPMSKLRGNT